MGGEGGREAETQIDLSTEKLTAYRVESKTQKWILSRNDIGIYIPNTVHRKSLAALTGLQNSQQLSGDWN